MDSSDFWFKFMVYFDKVDKILAVFGILFLFIGSGISIIIKDFSLSTTPSEARYFGIVGVVLILASLSPAVIAWIFRPVSLADLVDLKDTVDQTQAILDRGTPTSTRKEGDNQYFSMKEMPYAHASNTKAQTKLDSMIKALKN